MFRHTRNFASLALCLALTGTAVADTCGSVQGTNTIDRSYRPSVQNEFVTFTVTTTGSGSNTLTVKVQQQKSGGRWVTLRTVKVKPGVSVRSQYVVRDFFKSGSGEMVRYRISRKILTKKIEYCVSD